MIGWYVITHPSIGQKPKWYSQEGPAQWLSPSLPACRPSLSPGELIITVNHDGTRLQRLWAFYNLIRDVGADDGDRYDGVDVLLLCREVELDSGWGDDLRDGEGASPFVVELLHGAIRGVILEA